MTRFAPPAALRWSRSALLALVAVFATVTACGDQIVEPEGAVPSRLPADPTSATIGGVLSADLTLTAAGSPHTLTSDLEVPFGTTLTVEAGAQIIGGGFSIQVWGQFDVIGTSALPVVLDDVRVAPRGTASEPFQITIQHAEINGGHVYPATGNAIYGGLTLTDSRLTGVGLLYVWYPVSDVLIERNLFVASGGISVGTNINNNPVRVDVRHNAFSAWTTPFAVENWASVGGEATFVEYNSFLSTDRVAIRVPTGYTSALLNAPNNFWLSGSTEVVESMIFDRRDDLGSAHFVVYQPRLSEPTAETPLPGPLPTTVDTDGDGVEDTADICPLTWDPSQLDADGDGVGDACAPGGFGGILSGDVTLTPAGSPYTLDQPLQIPFGASLTIEAGVQLIGGGLSVEVWGELNVTGTAASPVVLDDVRVVAYGTTSEPYQITIQHAEINSGEVHPATGRAIYGGLTLTDSRLTGVGHLYIWYPVADVLIERNLFVASGGISVGTNINSNPIRVDIRNNAFSEWMTPYAVENWASVGGEATFVEYNSFLSTDRVALRVPAGYTSALLNAPNNYWGTVDPGTISGMIFDQTDDPASNHVVVFDPILSSPDVNTPSLPGSDSDGDGTPDDADLCPGFDDNADRDGDGTPDGCDTIHTGDLTITTQAELEGFPVLTEVTGRLNLQGADIDDLAPLASLTKVGSVLFLYQTSVPDLSALANLTEIGSTLYLRENANLVDLQGLNPNLSLNALDFRQNPSLASLDGFPNIGQIASISLTVNPALADLSALSSLTSVGSRISIQGSGLLTSLAGLEGVTNTGTLYLSYLNSLTDLTGLGSLAANHVQIENNAALQTLSPLTLVPSSRQFEIRANPALVDISSATGLTDLSANLIVWDNDALTDLTPLASLTSVANDFLFRGNGTLTTLAGLENLGSVGNRFYLEDNPVLSDCTAVAALLSGRPEAPNFISGNAPGCSTYDEVIGSLRPVLELGRVSRVTYTDGLREWGSRASGRRVVWLENTGANPLYLYDFDLGTQTQVYAGRGNPVDFDFSGDWVVYSLGNSIRRFDYATGSTDVVVSTPVASVQPRLDGSRMVWMESANGSYVMMYKDLETGDTRQLNPAGSVAYQGDVGGRHAAAIEIVAGVPQIVVYDLLAGLRTVVTNGEPSIQRPRVSRGNVIWSDGRTGTLQLYRYDVTSGSVSQLTSGPGVPSVNYDIDGERVVYVQDVAPNVRNVFLRESWAGSAVPVASSSAGQGSPAVGGEIVAWSDLRHGTEELYVLGIEPSPLIDEDGDGYPWPEDCNDQASEVYPGAPELLDSLDNDCDSLVDDGFVDADGDGVFALVPGGDGFFPHPDLADCDDSDPAFTRPGGPEPLDGLDNDCNGIVDDGDQDGDGVADYLDAFPYDPTETADTDGDGVGDNADVNPTDPSGGTPAGSDVQVQPNDQNGDPTPVSISFASVEAPGETSITTSTAGAPPTNAFRLGNPPVYYDVTTTAQFSGAVELCFDYSGQTFGNENGLKLLHDDGTGWTDVTTSLDTTNDIICGLTTSLSPFIVAEANEAPTVDAIALPADPIPVGTAIDFSALFTDANLFDTHTGTFDWGAGAVPGTVTEANGSGTLDLSQLFDAPGVYSVEATVSDGDLEGSRSSLLDEPAYIVVYDPSGSFVTGGGWIDSPAGACSWGDCTASTTGKANFGFVSKYRPGANVPTGETQFRFKAGDLDFRSTQYEWLVVAGARAQFKGVGEIDGQAGYGFMLTGIDGDGPGGQGVDRFRIKIWELATETVVYDNQRGADDTSDATTALGGGSIQVHR